MAACRNVLAVPQRKDANKKIMTIAKIRPTTMVGKFAGHFSKKCSLSKVALFNKPTLALPKMRKLIE